MLWEVTLNSMQVEQVVCQTLLYLELWVNHLDLFFRASYLCRLECFEISDVLGLKVLQGGLVARVKTAAESGQFVIAWNWHRIGSERVVALTATSELSHVLLLSCYIKRTQSIFFIHHIVIVANGMLGVEGAKSITLLLSCRHTHHVCNIIADSSGCLDHRQCITVWLLLLPDRVGTLGSPGDSSCIEVELLDMACVASVWGWLSLWLLHMLMCLFLPLQ